MNIFVPIYLTLLLSISAVYAQSRSAAQGDQCQGSMIYYTNAEMPEKMVPIALADNMGHPAGGQVIFLTNIRSAQANRCRHGMKAVIDVTLKLTMQTLITDMGVQNPLTGDLRTPAGIARSKSHEEKHRQRFLAAFQSYYNQYLPLTTRHHDLYNVMLSALIPLKYWVEDDWREVQRQENEHDTPSWRQWYHDYGYIW